MYQTVRCFVQRYITNLNIFHMYNVVSSLFTLISIYVSRKPLFQQVYDDSMIEYSEETAEDFISSESVIAALFANPNSETLNEVEMTTNATSESVSHPIKPEADNVQDGNIDINNISVLRCEEEPTLTKYWDKKSVKSHLVLGGSLLLLTCITVIVIVIFTT